MRKSLSTGFKTAPVICALIVLATGTRAVAQKEKQLYGFGINSTDATYPYAGLTFDTAGNLYGTTLYGGANNDGTVFELVKAGGHWTEKILHSFGSGEDGFLPQAGLTFDTAGNLYGTTYEGGAHKVGTVFELTRQSGGTWKENVLHSFNADGADGTNPLAGLIFDTAGNLYGTTYAGGTFASGTVFELTPKAGGGWTEKVLHSFGNGKDGIAPYAGLIVDTAGNLYGTTALGGPFGSGTVFELARKADGIWTHLTLFGFTGGEDGAFPYAGLILDASGHLYGTTYQGGVYDVGTAFEITP
jgi:uncharacterized repeat protein (TIGR03803 family)